MTDETEEERLRNMRAVMDATHGNVLPDKKPDRPVLFEPVKKRESFSFWRWLFRRRRARE